MTLVRGAEVRVNAHDCLCCSSLAPGSLGLSLAEKSGEAAVPSGAPVTAVGPARGRAGAKSAIPETLPGAWVRAAASPGRQASRCSAFCLARGPFRLQKNSRGDPVAPGPAALESSYPLPTPRASLLPSKKSPGGAKLGTVVPGAPPVALPQGREREMSPNLSEPLGQCERGCSWTECKEKWGAHVLFQPL